MSDADDQFLGMARPSRAVKEYATATGVELTISKGDKIIDQVINALLDPDNRSLVLNPRSRFTAV